MTRVFLLLFSLIACTLPSLAFDRDYIRRAIKENGCRNVAITKTNGDLMLYGKNGCARSGCPADLNKAIEELNGDGEFIDDVCLTENGNWLVLYGDNGCQWNNIPYDLERTIRNYNNKGETILTAVFNDSGLWAVVTTEHFSASDGDFNDWLKEGLKKFGMLWTVCLTDDCVIAIYENGYTMLGDVPYDLRDKLSTTSMNVYRLKVAGSAWFMADLDGHYAYNM